MPRDLSYEQLLAIADQNPASRINIARMLASSHEERTALVEDALDEIAREFAQSPKERCDRSEEDYNVDVVSCLKSMGFKASHDTKNGGHVDIYIEERDGFVWLGEAKIYTSESWLHAGYKQLMTRYASGVEGQESGGIIVYFNNKSKKPVCEAMNSWGEFLTSQYKEVSKSQCNKNRLAFITHEPHPQTGISYRVRHIPFVMRWDPAK